MNETHTFTVNRSLNRVRQSAMKTDEWVPLLFSMGYDGKRVKKKEGQVGAIYLAELYEITTSFAKDKRELFKISEISESSIIIRHEPNRQRFLPEQRPQIVLKWSEIDRHHTKIELTQVALPPATRTDCGPITVLLLCFARHERKIRQNREDCHEELKLYLSC
jgi:hypothetical protein